MKNNHPIVFGFEFNNKADYQEALRIACYAPNDRNENFDYCVLRERGIEVMDCRKAEYPYVVFDKNRELIDSNVDVESLDKDVVRLVLRLNRPASDTYLGLKPLLSSSEGQKVLRWPESVVNPDKFLSRKVEIVSNDDMASSLKKGNVPLPCFIKTVDKGPRSNLSLHRVFETAADLGAFNSDSGSHRTWGDTDQSAITFTFKSPDWYCEYREQMQAGAVDCVAIKDDFIVSDVMAIESDEQADSGKIEYRAYIIDGRLISISRYVDYDSMNVPSDAKAFAQSFADLHADVFPEIYVCDIAKTDRGYQVIELNPYEQSGRYLNNDSQAFYRTLVASHNQGYAFPMRDPDPLPEKEEDPELDWGDIGIILDM